MGFIEIYNIKRDKEQLKNVLNTVTTKSFKHSIKKKKNIRLYTMLYCKSIMELNVM